MSEKNSYFTNRYGCSPEEADEGVRKKEFLRLMGVAEEKGFQRGWIGHQFKDLFGEWPPRDWENKAQAAQSSRRGSPKRTCPTCGGSGTLVEK